MASDLLQRRQAHPLGVGFRHGSSRSSALCWGSRPVGSNTETVRPGSKAGGKQAICLSCVTALPGAGVAWCANRRPMADTGAQRGGLPGQAMQRLPAARGHDHRPVHLRAPLRYPGPRDQRRGKLHRHSLSLSVTLSTDETSRQAVIRSGVTGLLEAP